MTENEIAHQIVDAAYQVHKVLGPGLLESYYSEAMAIELGVRGLQFTVDQLFPVTYKGVTIEEGFRVDLMVEDEVMVELKAEEAVSPIYAEYLQNYLRLTGKRLGLLINFNVPSIEAGITRIANGLPQGGPPSNPNIRFCE